MEFWGVPPLLGRGFSEQDVQSGTQPGRASQLPVLEKAISWRQEHPRTTMMLNGKERTIVGVMPPRFQAVGADLYMPSPGRVLSPFAENLSGCR